MELLSGLSYLNVSDTLTFNTGKANNVIFTGATSSTNTYITLNTYSTSNGTLSFEGSAGQLFTITNDLSNLIFSVSDVSGIPSFEVYANGLVSLIPISGNVGINNTTPSDTLSIDGTAYISGNLHISGDNGNNPLLKFENTDGTNSGNTWSIKIGEPGTYDGYFMLGRGNFSVPGDFYITSSGVPTFDNGVGIGDDTSFNSASSGSLAFYQPFNTTSSTLTSRIMFRNNRTTSNDASFVFSGYYNDGASWNFVDNILNLRAKSATEKRVGVGTGSPTEMLDVAGNTVLRNSTTPTKLELYNTYTDASNYERGFVRMQSNFLQIGVESSGTGSDRSVSLMFGSSEKLRTAIGSVMMVDALPLSNANYDLGTSSFQWGNLYVVNSNVSNISSAVDSRAWIFKTPDGTKTYLDAEDSNQDIAIGSNFTDVYFINNGNVGIGNTTPTYKLHVEGTTYVSGQSNLQSISFHRTGLGTYDKVIDLTVSGNYWRNDGALSASSFAIENTNQQILIQNAEFRTRNDGKIGFSNGNPISYAADAYFTRDDSGIIAQKNSTNAQTSRIYGTYTDASNYERLSLSANSSGNYVSAEKAGTGSARSLYLNCLSGQLFFNDGNSQARMTSGNWEFGNRILTQTYGITSTDRTLSQSVPLIDLGQTWNASANTFTATKINITDTASASDSLLVNYQKNSNSVFKLYKSGEIRVNDEQGDYEGMKITQGYNSTSFSGVTNSFRRFTFSTAVTFGISNIHTYIRGDSLLGWSTSTNSQGTLDFGLHRDVSTSNTSVTGILAQRNSTNPQTSRIYGTYTDASNYERLSLSANSTASYIQAEKAGTGTARPLYIGANNSTAMTVASNGNIGIGTTSPIGDLDIVASTNDQNNILTVREYRGGGLFKISESGDSGILTLGYYGLTSSRIYFNGGLGAGHSEIKMFRGTGSTTPNAYISTSDSYFNGGNVGIGTTTPSYKLDVDGEIRANDVRITSNSSSESSGVALQRFFSKSVSTGQLYKLCKFNDTEGTVQFMITVSSETSSHSGTSTYIFQGGYSQLGGTNGWYRLLPLHYGRGHGNGPDTGENSSAWNVLIYGTAISGSPYTYGVAVSIPSGVAGKTLKVTVTELKRGMAFTDESSSSVITSWTIDGTIYSQRNLLVEGNVGIGTSTPAYKLEVNGSVSSNGTIYAEHFDNVSDIKFKENIKTIKSSKDIIKNLNPVSFTWKDTGEKSFGLIAQEVEKILPEIVHSKSDNTKTVSYIQLIPFLIQIIKEQQEQIDYINNKLDNA